jgi:hypothetical protein
MNRLCSGKEGITGHLPDRQIMYSICFGEDCVREDGKIRRNIIRLNDSQ